jgi:hypothetical protein
MDFPKLLILDCDSTLSAIEGIDERRQVQLERKPRAQRGLDVGHQQRRAHGQGAEMRAVIQRRAAAPGPGERDDGDACRMPLLLFRW